MSKMKPYFLIALLSLAGTTWSAVAAISDHSYYVTELASPQKFDVYNDGQNTYLESIPGLVVTGATADGERYIVNGVPHQIRGFMNGKAITVVRGSPPVHQKAIPDTAVVNERIKQLTEKLESLTSKATVAASPAMPSQPATLVPSPPTTPESGLLVPPSTRAQSQEQATGAAETPAAVAVPRSPTINDVYLYSVSPADQNLRLVIDRWARMVGWSAVWDVDRDITVSSVGQKTNDWKSAVRWVLSSTELGDLVVKPCFYNNSVVRVVRKTVKCNPNE